MWAATEELQRGKKRSTHILGEGETKKGVKGVKGVVALEERRHWRRKGCVETHSAVAFSLFNS